MNSMLRRLSAAACMLAFTAPAVAQCGQGLPWCEDPFLASVITGSQRSVVHEDIVHYRFDVTAGPGRFDAVRVHRVLREAQGSPAAGAAPGVVLLPGAPNLFEGIFMSPAVSAVPARDHSVAIYLAQNGIDVWGLDYGWLFVPAETTDFTFLKGWGVDKDTVHAQLALSVAHRIRTLTGQGAGPLHLLGFSYGGWIAYSVAGAEAEQPPGARLVSGLVAVDSDVKFAEDSPRAEACAKAARAGARLDAGSYQIDAPFRTMGEQARSDATGPSPAQPGHTNLQAALELGMAGGFVTGIREEDGRPQRLSFTDDWLWVDLLRATPPYLPRQVMYDVFSGQCDDPALARAQFNGRLGKIAVSILHVDSAEYAGPGQHTAALTASQDVSAHLVLQPQFGHADLFLARDAASAVWRPMLEWILAH